MSSNSKYSTIESFFILREKKIKITNNTNTTGASPFLMTSNVNNFNFAVDNLNQSVLKVSKI